MKLNFENERVLAVVAHPDDAELLCAGTLARARLDGAVIGICVLCRGEKGQPRKPIASLAAIRRKEVTAAAKLLGAHLFFGDHPDGELEDSNPSRAKLTEIFRQFKPSLILAHALKDYHPDHRAAGKLAEAASWFCASSGYKTRSQAIENSPALWWMDTLDMSGFAPGFYIDVSDFTDLKARMLACHKSQLQRGGDKDFSPLEELMRLQYQSRGLQAGAKAAEAFRAHHAFKRARAW